MAFQRCCTASLHSHTRHSALGPTGRLPATEKLRIATLRFGTGRQKLALGRWTTPKLSRRTCSPRHGPQSCRGKPAGVAKLPRERPPTRKPPPFRFAVLWHRCKAVGLCVCVCVSGQVQLVCVGLFPRRGAAETALAHLTYGPEPVKDAALSVCSSKEKENLVKRLSEMARKSSSPALKVS